MSFYDLITIIGWAFFVWLMALIIQFNIKW